MRIIFNKKFLKYLEKQGLTIIRPLIILDKVISIESNFEFELPCSINAELLVYKNRIKMGAYSVMGNNASIQSNTTIGRYCTISNNSAIGLQSHPMNQLSTSAYFYAENYFNNWNAEYKELISFSSNKTVTIGNDVWICKGAGVASGVTIGNGAVIGQGAYAKRDVEPYTVIVGDHIVLPKYYDRMRPNFFGKEPNWWKYDQVTNHILKPKTLNRASLQKLYNKFRWLNWLFSNCDSSS